jgi:signal transduction histidine kinase
MSEEGSRSWKILIADDEPDLHALTALVLRNLTFDGRALEFLHAYTGAQTLELLRREPDVAVVLLDVVMETEQDGLEVCRGIRKDLQNSLVRIVLRTGQPGVAPERQVVEEYDIDDYREKADLSNEKLYTCVRLALKNYRDLLRIQQLYEESLSLRRATDKALSHLSHELHTPLAILRAVLTALAREEDAGARRDLIERGERNLLRLLELRSEIQEIYRGTNWRRSDVDPLWLYRGLVARLDEQVRSDPSMGMELLHLKARELEDLFLSPEGEAAESFDLGDALPSWVEAHRPGFAHRAVRLMVQSESPLPVAVNRSILEQACTALLRNAVENTPDGGLIRVSANLESPEWVRLTVADRGVGITTENQRYLFSGFFHTQATELYSSRRHFDFDAGGKGLDLLRLKVWADRFGWRLEFDSERCVYLPTERDLCPGRILACTHCRTEEDCERSGGSRFSLLLPRGSNAGPA